MQSGRFAFLIVTFTYLVAAVVFVLVLGALRHDNYLLATLTADIASTVVVFAFSVLANNSSVYDPYWSVLPPVIFLCWVVGIGTGAAPTAELSLRAAMIIVLTLIWSIRLTANWAVRWQGLRHEDWRYREFRDATGAAYWGVSFLGIHLFPTLTVFAGALPVYYALRGANGAAAPFQWLDILAVAVTVAAIVVEGLADAQMNRFRSGDAGGVIRVGLWNWSRHPNYLGEMGFWLGLFLFGVAAGAPVWTGVGMVAPFGVFFGFSIPKIEKRLIERHPEYREVQRTVSMLIPLPPRERTARE